MFFGSEQESFQFLEPYLQELEAANLGFAQYFMEDSENRFLRCGFIAPYAANFLRMRNGIPVIQADMALSGKPNSPA